MEPGDRVRHLSCRVTGAARGWLPRAANFVIISPALDEGWGPPCEDAQTAVIAVDLGHIAREVGRHVGRYDSGQLPGIPVSWSVGPIKEVRGARSHVEHSIRVSPELEGASMEVQVGKPLLICAGDDWHGERVHDAGCVLAAAVPGRAIRSGFVVSVAHVYV